MPDLEPQSELWRGSWSFGMRGWKYVEMGRLDFFLSVRKPLTDHFWTPFFGWKKCQPCIRGDLKKLKWAKDRAFGHLMHSIASPSPGLRYKIHLWGHWHHCNGFIISRKKTTLLLQKSRFCSGGSTRDISKFTAYMDFYSQKKVYVRSRTTERIVTWE